MTGNRSSIRTGSGWESRYGYCRAVAVGDAAWVAGTTAASDGADPARDASTQAEAAFGIALRALDELGFVPDDVVRTRVFLTDIADADAVGLVHAQFFAIVRPVATMVAVDALIDPSLVVEIELEARRALRQ